MTNPYAPQGMPAGPPAPQGYDPNVQAGYAPPQYGQPPNPYGPPAGYAPPQYTPPNPYGPPAGYAPQLPYGQPPVPQQPAVDISQYIDNGLKAQGAFWKFETFGQQHTGLVARDLTVSDIEQGEYQNVKQWNKDGSPRLRLLVPVVQPDGAEAQWDVKQAEFKSLATAMNAAGITENLSTIREIIAHIHAGDAIRVTYTHDRPNKSGMPSKMKTIEFTRGSGVAPASVQAQQPVQAQYAPPAPAPTQVQFPQQPPTPAPLVGQVSTPPPGAPGADAQAAWLASLPPQEQDRIRAMLGQNA